MAEASVDPSLQVSAMVVDANEQDEEAIDQALTEDSIKAEPLVSSSLSSPGASSTSVDLINEVVTLLLASIQLAVKSQLFNG